MREHGREAQAEWEAQTRRRATLLLEALERIRAGGSGVAVIAIDGRSAAGKTSLARELARMTGAGVVHMDDFFLPVRLRTAGRLAEPGGNVHYERFLQEVIPGLRENGAFAYRRFDCHSMQPGELCRVPEAEGDAALRIVEGAYSCHPIFGEYADLKVFVDVEPDVQLARIERRGGREALEAFRTRWIPLEETYFSACSVREAADIIL